MHLWLLLLAFSHTVAKENFTLCQDPQFQEEEVTKDMKEWADLAVPEVEKLRISHGARHIAIGKLLFDSVSSRRDLRKKFHAEMKDNYYWYARNPQLSVDEKIAGNRDRRAVLQNYITSCNLTETGAVEKAITQMYSEALEPLYSNATDDARIEIIKRIAAEHRIFDWKPRPPPRCQDPEYQEEEVLKDMKVKADDISFAMDLHAESILNSLKQRLRAIYVESFYGNSRRINETVGFLFENYKLSHKSGETARYMEYVIKWNRRFREDISWYMQKCNLTGNNQFLLALNELFVEASRRSYATANDEERMETIKSIFAKHSVFSVRAGTSLQTPTSV